MADNISIPQSIPYAIPPQPPYFNNEYLVNNISKIHNIPNIIRIPNIHHYTQEIINGELLLIQKEKYINDNTLKMVQITNSTTIECIVKEREKTILTNNTNSKDINLDIWKSPESTLNIKIH